MIIKKRIITGFFKFIHREMVLKTLFKAVAVCKDLPWKSERKTRALPETTVSLLQGCVP